MTQKLSRLFFIISAILFASPIINAQTMSDDRLAHEGRRIGLTYHLALKSGDTDMQNDAINQFNDILVTLRTQTQADILTNAFNNINIPITKPETDAIIYTRAIMNARAKNDSIAIEDANDIAAAVKEIYLTDRNAEESQLYAGLFEKSLAGATWGAKYSTADESAKSAIKADADNFKAAFQADTVAVKVFNDSFDYYSINLTTPDEDAKKYSAIMKDATASGQQANVDAAARIIGLVYERYCFDRNGEEAKQFETAINELNSK